LFKKNTAHVVAERSFPSVCQMWGSGSILYMRVVVGSVFVRLGMGTSIFVVVDPCTGRTDSVDVLVATLGDSDVAALATAPL